MSPRRIPGFTLIEVLVVVAIIALLIAILLPSLAAVRTSARNTQCLSNLHQFGIAVQAYASTWKEVVPRGGSPGETTYWTTLVARQFGDRKPYPNPNLLDFPKHPIYQCPERTRSIRPPFVDYVVNALDPQGPRKLSETTKYQWNEVKHSRLSDYAHAADVVYLCDAELESKNTSGAGGAMKDIRQTYLSTDWTDTAMWYKSGIDAMDVWTGEELPECKGGVNISDKAGPRRVARKLHFGRLTNALHMDSHASGLPLARPGLADIDKYALWLRRFGVRDVQAVKLLQLAY